MATRTKPTPDELRELLRGIRLVTLTRAAAILGIAPPNVSRMRNDGRFPEPVIEIDGGAGVYDEREVKQLDRELKRSRRNGR
jgi:predicted DNA-binding transcriptional regulator AlpA